MEEGKSKYAGLPQQNGLRPAFWSSLLNLRIPWENPMRGGAKTDPFDLGPQNGLTISPKNLMM
jgi:hypothetical protein